MNPKYNMHKKSTSILFGWSALAPADSTTYRPSPLSVDTVASTTSNLAYQIKLDRSVSDFTLSLCSARGSAPSNELVTIQLYNVTKATSVNFTTTYDLLTSGVNAEYFEAQLYCDRNDYLELRFITPVWVTNPTNWRIGATLSF